MKISDDPNDPFADELRHEAMSERPQFSPQLHDQIIARISDECRRIPSSRAARPRRWLPIVAAAATVIACGTAFWAGRSYFISMPKPTIRIARNPAPIADPVDRPVLPSHLSDFSVNVGGFLTATLWPPEIHVRLPVSQSISERAPDPTAKLFAEPKPLPGSPEWMLAALQQPTLEVKTALIELIPTELRMLVDMARRN